MIINIDLSLLTFSSSRANDTIRRPALTISGVKGVRGRFSSTGAKFETIDLDNVGRIYNIICKCKSARFELNLGELQNGRQENSPSKSANV